MPLETDFLLPQNDFGGSGIKILRPGNSIDFTKPKSIQILNDGRVILVESETQGIVLSQTSPIVTPQPDIPMVPGISEVDTAFIIAKITDPEIMYDSQIPEGDIEILYSGTSQTTLLSTMQSLLNSFPTDFDNVVVHLGSNVSLTTTLTLTKSLMRAGSKMVISAPFRAITTSGTIATLIQVAGKSPGVIEFKNLEISNADVTATNRCLVRADGSNNITFDNVIFDTGFCALRATTGAENILINSCTVRNTINGSFRLGNGVWSDGIDAFASNYSSVRTRALHDCADITISNCIFETEKSLIIVKKCFNLNVINNTFTGLKTQMFLELENSTNVLVRNFLINNTLSDSFLHYFITGVRGLELDNIQRMQNVNTSATILSINESAEIKLKNSNLRAINANDSPVNMINVKLIQELTGNYFKGLNNVPVFIQLKPGTQLGDPSIASDILIADNNTYETPGDFNEFFQITDNPWNTQFLNIRVQKVATPGKITPATYRSTYNKELNSVFIPA